MKAAVWVRVFGLALVLALLAACKTGPVRRVSEPAARIQQLTVKADGSWSVDLRIENFSSIPMQFDRIDLQLKLGEESAGPLQARPALSIGPEVFESRGSHGVLLQERSVTERAKFHYYLAKTYAKNGRTELALLYIRKSLEEGFKERKKYMQDAEFETIRSLPEFEELMKLEPRVL